MRGFVKYFVQQPIALFQSKLRFWLSKSPPVLVFTMAKVGSLSIYNSLKTQTSIPCFHIHTLNAEEDNLNIKECLSKGLYPDSRSPISFILNNMVVPQKPIKIISLFRDPIERNISAFFDAFELYVGIPPHEHKGDIQFLIDCYFNKLPHNYACNWFDNQFKRDTGIDVYHYNFDSAKGFKILKKENIEVLIMNSAIPNDEKEQLIKDFLSLNHFELNNTNVTSSKLSGKLYESFKTSIQFEKEHLDLLLNSAYAQHFLSKDEINASYLKWLKDD